MPAPVRKSSLGTSRRGPQPYIPYRGDDFQHGKRTGMAVALVEHSSDDFEPFEEVLKQADAYTPPRPKIQKRRKQAPKTPVVQEPEYDDNGEKSMDLVDSKSAHCTIGRILCLNYIQVPRTVLPCIFPALECRPSRQVFIVLVHLHVPFIIRPMWTSTRFRHLGDRCRRFRMVVVRWLLYIPLDLHVSLLPPTHGT